MLNVLVRGQFSDGESDYERILHFEDVDETTRRLVVRCATVDWLRPPQEPASAPLPPVQSTSDDVPPIAEEIESPPEISRTVTEASSPEPLSPTRTDEPVPTIPNTRSKPTHADRLGMHLDRASSSSLSVQEVASQHEKPGVITPSRAHQPDSDYSPTKTSKQKTKPEPPNPRRRGRRLTLEENKARDESLGHSNGPIDRRNSAGASSLAPPPVPTIPAHAYRSASIPPPAVPPPRRSAFHHGNGSSTGGGHGKYGQKPEPPKSRRWGRTRHQHAAHEPATPTVDSPVDSESGEKSLDTPTVTVEEAVQNVSPG